MISKIINVYKPKFFTSNETIQIIKKLLGLKKIGHAGTLDPMAEGVLIVATNNATKDISKIITEEKSYYTEIVFNKETTTYDEEGDVLKTTTNHINLEDIEKALIAFQNEYYQTPPAYSAKKINGVRAYELARKNIQFELKPCKVILKEYKIIKWDENTKTLSLLVKVSKGFYIRSLAHDLGVALNDCAYCTKIVRTQVGKFHIKDSIKITDIKKFLTIDLNEEELIIQNESKPLILGFFDGIHQGHQKLIDATNGEPYDILLFNNVPRKQEYLYPFNDRLDAINKNWKPYTIYYYDINKNNIDSLSFINQYLKKINPSKIIIGSDYTYGNDRANAQSLSKYFETIIIDKCQEQSSSVIKKYLNNGEVDKANALLLEPYYRYSMVVRGGQDGRQLGFPTCNIVNLDNLVKLKEGSYATSAFYNNEWHKSISFCGNSKTIIKHRPYPTLETFILENYQTIKYFDFIKVQINQFIRPNQSFKNKKELIEAISSDIEVAKNLTNEK